MCYRCHMHAVIVAVALFYTATDGKDDSLLSKMVGAEAASGVPAEAVALSAFAACGACSLPIVWLASAADASGVRQSSQAKKATGHASSPSSPRRSASPASGAGKDKEAGAVRHRQGATDTSD